MSLYINLYVLSTCSLRKLSLVRNMIYLCKTRNSKRAKLNLIECFDKCRTLS